MNGQKTNIINYRVTILDSIFKSFNDRDDLIWIKLIRLLQREIKSNQKREKNDCIYYGHTDFLVVTIAGSGALPGKMLLVGNRHNKLMPN